MDRIALISDLHGNLPALEAVLHDIQGRGIRRILCLGDLVGKGPDSAATLDIAREMCEATVRGNWDDFTGAPSKHAVIQWHQARLGPERMAYLAALPNSIDFQMSGRNVRLFHASPEGVYHRVHMDDTPEKQRAMFGNTPFTASTVVPDVVGYGDIHRAYVKTFQHGILFNTGSVGNPLDMTQAAYAILEGLHASAEPAPFSIQIVRLPYDIERAIHDAEQAHMPELDAYANELRTAHYRGRPKN